MIEEMRRVWKFAMLYKMGGSNFLTLLALYDMIERRKSKVRENFIGECEEKRYVSPTLHIHIYFFC